MTLGVGVVDVVVVVGSAAAAEVMVAVVGEAAVTCDPRLDLLLGVAGLARRKLLEVPTSNSLG